MQRKHLAIVATWLALSATSTLSAAVTTLDTTLDFNAPVPGTLNDSAGQGSGFTTRLPGTGSAIAANDPNLTLDTANGQLVLRSTNSSPNYAAAGYQNNAANLVSTDLPALLLSGIGSDDFIVRARFTNLNLPAPSDQIGVFVGAAISNVVRGGTFFDIPSVGNGAGFTYGQNGSDGAPSNGEAGTFQPGENGQFEIGRISGVWHFGWQNLSTGDSDTYSFSVPGLDSQNDLYVGIFNLDPYGVLDAHAGNGTPSTPYNAYLQSFTVLTGASVPEPSTFALGILGALSLAVFGRRVRGKRLSQPSSR